MSYRFFVVGLKSRKVVERDLPFLIQGNLTRKLQGYGSGTLQLPISHPATPANWEQLILPWRNMILVTDEDQNIIWHGIPNDRERSAPGLVDYPCATIEAYFLRRYVPTLNFRGVEQTEIARRLAAVCGDSVGIPLDYDCQPSGVIRDRLYSLDEEARVYNRLQELSAVIDGFNWTVDVQWANSDKSEVRYVFRTGYPHLGRRTFTPNHVFELPGNIASFPTVEDRWGDGDAATHVRAVGDGQGEVKPLSSAVVDSAREDAGWPRLEERRSFSGVVIRTTLESHARKLAKQMFGGQELITLTARHDGNTRLADIALGDTAAVRIETTTVNLYQLWVITEWSLSANTSTYTPTLQRLEA